MDPVESLRDALRLSPDNLPLQRHLAETLLTMGRLEEARDAYRTALALAPRDQASRLGLGRTFYRLGAFDEALVLIEELVGDASAPAAAGILLARLLRRRGDVAGAVAAYRRAVRSDPGSADAELGAALGIDADDADEVVDGRLRPESQVPTTLDAGEVERPAIGFAEVGGMEVLKDQIRMKIIHPLKNPDLFKAYGKKVGGGILLYGPPGCGKTHLARAVAGEIESGFVAVGIDDVLEMWIGNSERNLAAIFDNARSHRPCVLFFDEVDALASRRSDLRTSAGRMVINQFLSEMDGIDAKNDGLLILAATNAPWHVDPAFRRPGRFDRIIFVPPPDSAARAEILRIHLAGKPAEDLDVEAIAAKAKDYSGADLQAVVDHAVELRLEEAMRTGHIVPLRTRDLLAGLKRHKPTTREWLASAKNHALYANHDGLYDEILEHLKLR